MGQISMLAARMVPLIALGSKYATRTARGVQQVATLAQTLVAQGGNLIATEVRVTDAAGKVIGRFRADLLVQLPNRVTAFLESKGIPWHLYGKGGNGWQTFMSQLQRQADAFADAQQTLGVVIQQRIITLSSKAPEGLEAAQAEIQELLATRYQQILWGVADFEKFLEKLQ